MKELIIFEYPKVFISDKSTSKVALWDWDNFKTNNTAYLNNNYAKLENLEQKDKIALVVQIEEELDKNAPENIKKILENLKNTPSKGWSLLTIRNQQILSFDYDRFVLLNISSEKEFYNQKEYLLHELSTLPTEQQREAKKTITEFFKKIEKHPPVTTNRPTNSWIKLDL